MCKGWALQDMSLFARKPLTSAPELSRIKAPKYMTIDERLNNWANQFKKKEIGFVFCPHCGKTMLNDNLYIQNHMKQFHVKDRLKNREKKWSFHVTNKPIFGENAFKIASDKKMRDKQWSP